MEPFAPYYAHNLKYLLKYLCLNWLSRAYGPRSAAYRLTERQATFFFPIFLKKSRFLIWDNRASPFLTRLKNLTREHRGILFSIIQYFSLSHLFFYWIIENTYIIRSITLSVKLMIKCKSWHWISIRFYFRNWFWNGYMNGFMNRIIVIWIK